MYYNECIFIQPATSLNCYHKTGKRRKRKTLPAFCFTPGLADGLPYNDFSKEILIRILTHPLSSEDEIINRQLVLKSFIANHNILSNYSYSRLDLLEVHAFLESSNNEVSTKGLKLKFFLSETKRHQTSRKYIQTVLLFHRLNNYYFKRIDTRLFPENYKRELQSLNDFFNSFNLNYYEKLIQDQKFKAKHVI